MCGLMPHSKQDEGDDDKKEETQRVEDLECVQRKLSYMSRFSVMGKIHQRPCDEDADDGEQVVVHCLGRFATQN